MCTSSSGGSTAGGTGAAVPGAVTTTLLAGSSGWSSAQTLMVLVLRARCSPSCSHPPPRGGTCRGASRRRPRRRSSEGRPLARVPRQERLAGAARRRRGGRPWPPRPTARASRAAPGPTPRCRPPTPQVTVSGRGPFAGPPDHRQPDRGPDQPGGLGHVDRRHADDGRPGSASSATTSRSCSAGAIPSETIAGNPGPAARAVRPGGHRRRLRRTELGRSSPAGASPSSGSSRGRTTPASTPTTGTSTRGRATSGSRSGPSTARWWTPTTTRPSTRPSWAATTG